MVATLAICGIRKGRTAQVLGLWSLLGCALFLSVWDDLPI